MSLCLSRGLSVSAAWTDRVCQRRLVAARAGSHHRRPWIAVASRRTSRSQSGGWWKAQRAMRATSRTCMRASSPRHCSCDCCACSSADEACGTRHSASKRSPVAGGSGTPCQLGACVPKSWIFLIKAKSDQHTKKALLVRCRRHYN